MTDKPIIKMKTQILTPRLWYLLREHLPTEPTNYQILCDVFLHTGMRIEEFWEFLDHEQWFFETRKCIDLPKTAIGKARCTMQGRTVLLNPAGVAAVKALFTYHKERPISYIDRSNMRKLLIRAAKEANIDPEGITPKMFRKTLVSLLWATMPEKYGYILASIGHCMEVDQRHYLAMGFEKRDVEDMRKFLKGWGKA